MHNDKKDYSYDLTVLSPDGSLHQTNVSRPELRYRQSWYKTESAARKGLQNAIKFREFCGDKVFSWVLYCRNPQIGIIEKYNAERGF